MKLSKYIKDLQELLNQHGDMECYWSSDDEGNDLTKLTYSGCAMYANITNNPYYLDSITDVQDEEHNTKICIIN